jgi:hypothetical protein
MWARRVEPGRLSPSGRATDDPAVDVLSTRAVDDVCHLLRHGRCDWVAISKWQRFARPLDHSSDLASYVNRTFGHENGKHEVRAVDHLGEIRDVDNVGDFR